MNKKQKLQQLIKESNRRLRRFNEPQQIVSDIETKVTIIAEVSRECSITKNSIYKWIYSYFFFHSSTTSPWIGVSGVRTVNKVRNTESQDQRVGKCYRTETDKDRF